MHREKFFLEYPIGLNVSPCVIGICRGSITMMKRAGIFLVSTAFMISAAVAQMAPAKIGETSKGKALVNDKGMTLYVFDKDKDVPGKSACNGPCADNWPALHASDTDKGSETGRSSHEMTARRCGPTRAARCTLGRTTRRPVIQTAMAS